MIMTMMMTVFKFNPPCSSSSQSPRNECCPCNSPSLPFPRAPPASHPDDFDFTSPQSPVWWCPCPPRCWSRRTSSCSRAAANPLCDAKTGLVNRCSSWLYDHYPSNGDQLSDDHCEYHDDCDDRSENVSPVLLTPSQMAICTLSNEKSYNFDNSDQFEKVSCVISKQE